MNVEPGADQSRRLLRFVAVFEQTNQVAVAGIGQIEAVLCDKLVEGEARNRPTAVR